MDFFIDLYDLGQSILAFDWTWGGLANIGLNVVGLIPGVGDLAKTSRLGKNAIKTVDAVADVTDGLNDARKAIKRTDALVDARKAAKNVGNTADALDTANDARKAAKTFATEKEFTDYARNKVSEIRNSMPGRKLRKEGNVVVAFSDIEGLPSEFVAHSKISRMGHRGSELYNFSLLQEKRSFSNYIEEGHDRVVDTEAKILEDIYSRVKDKNITGTIYLYTELSPCPSCQNIIKEFNESLPNVILKVFYGQGNLSFDGTEFLK